MQRLDTYKAGLKYQEQGQAIGIFRGKQLIKNPVNIQATNKTDIKTIL